MEIISHKTTFDFIGNYRIPVTVSAVLVLATIFLLFTRGLNLGLDFTGGTLVELGYNESIDVSAVRDTLAKNDISDAVVQHFGTTRDIMIRLPVRGDAKSAVLSNKVIEILRDALGEKLVASGAGNQLCQGQDAKTKTPCQIQVRRVEFVGPQIGDELTEKGGLAMIYTLIAILIYVMLRFEWRFAVGSVIAIAHDVLLTFGFFALTQIEFSLSVLAAILAVLGYSLNDTIVVFDRIRENFRKMRKGEVSDILNTSINQTLSRTIITSGTTLVALIALFILGGEIIHGFAIALIVGIVIGTYSSIYIATPAVLALNITREDMMPVKKEGAPDSQV